MGVNAWCHTQVGTFAETLPRTGGPGQTGSTVTAGGLGSRVTGLVACAMTQHALAAAVSSLKIHYRGVTRGSL